MKSLTERVDAVEKLWTLAIGDVSLPTGDKMLYWCGAYSDDEIEYAFIRASRKLHAGGIVKTTSEIEKYISGVLFHEAQTRREKLARKMERTLAMKEGL